MKSPKQYQTDQRQQQLNHAEEAAVAYLPTVNKNSVAHILDLDALQINEPLRRIATFRKGLSKKSFDHLKKITGLDYNKLSSALAVSVKTLQRKEIFDLVQSERMYALAELYALGMGYFGEDGFKRWMDRPLFSIGNIRPIDLIDVSEGIVMLRGEIMRVQHGIAV